jgi:hypothetical protein
MRALPATWVVLFCALGLAACKTSQTYQFKDTEGREFTAVCKSYKNGPNCSDLKEVQGPPAHPAGSVSFRAHPGWKLGGVSGSGHSRYLAVCESWIGEERKTEDGTMYWSAQEDCRIVACNADADCPAYGPTLVYACVKGLCANPSARLADEDVKSLCLAGTGPWTNSPAQQKARDLVIGGPTGLCGPDGKAPCAVPPFCRQP